MVIPSSSMQEAGNQAQSRRVGLCDAGRAEEFEDLAKGAICATGDDDAGAEA
jgi:hypothetical protein